MPESLLGFLVRAGSEQLPYLYSTLHLCLPGKQRGVLLRASLAVLCLISIWIHIQASDKQNGDKIYPLVLFPTHSKIEGCQSSQEQTSAQLGGWAPGFPWEVGEPGNWRSPYFLLLTLFLYPAAHTITVTSQVYVSVVVLPCVGVMLGPALQDGSARLPRADNVMAHRSVLPLVITLSPW